MRITIVQGAFMPVPPVLGTSVEKIWFALGREFARRGHAVTHISRCYSTLEREEVIEGVHHIRIRGFDAPSSLVKLKLCDLVYSRRALRVLPEADVLVTNTFWLPILAPSASSGKVYVHVARYPRGQMKLYGKAARLQAVSSLIGNAICSEAPQLSERVKVIPNFVGQNAPLSVDPKRENSILYVGRLHPEKGIHLLLEAFANLLSEGVSGWKLQLIGSWEVSHGGAGREYFETLRKASEPIQQAIEWVGPVFDAGRLGEYYRRANFFVYPSTAGRGEASPLAPLEAMAEGCPAVVSSLDCFRDYLRSDRNGWTFDESAKNCVASLTATLRHVVSHPGMRDEIRSEALKTAQHYSLSQIADRYLSDFEEVLAA